MTTPEVLSFNPGDFAFTISRPDYTYHRLANDIYRTRRRIAAIPPKALTAIANAVASGPTSLSGLLYNSREYQIEKTKLDLLEKEWARRGQWPLPHRPLQDTVFPVMLTCASGVIAVMITLNLISPVHDIARRVDVMVRGYWVGTWISSAFRGGVSMVVAETLKYLHDMTSDEEGHRVLDFYGPWRDAMQIASQGYKKKSQHDSEQTDHRDSYR